jgi:hypothetical protein
MLRATLILRLSVSWSVLVLAADPTPAQADFEPKLLRPPEAHAAPDTTPMRGPEDFALPASDPAPRPGKDTDAQERAARPQPPSNAPVLEGF